MSEGQAPGTVESVDRDEYQLLRAENERLRAALAEARAEPEQPSFSGNLLHEFLDASPYFVYAKDLQGRYILANAAYLSLYGLGSKELLGKQDQERFAPQIAADLRANDQAVVEAGHPLQFEEVLTQNGRDVYYLSTKFPLRDPQGAVYAVCGISTDITEQKQVEKALRESEARFRLAIDAAPALVYASDLESDEILSVYGLEKLLGREASEVRSRQWWMEQVHPDDLAAAFEEMQAATATGRNFELEYRVRHADGHYLDVRENTTVIQDKEGHPLRHVGVVIDISPRKEAERELKALTEALEERVAERTRALVESRDQFARLFHASPVAGSISTLEDGRFLDVNARFAETVGYPRAEIVGKTTSELALWGDPPARAQLVERLTVEGMLQQHELGFQTRAGEQRTALASVELIELHGERCILAMYVDITDRIRTENQIQSLSQALTLAEQRERRRLSAVLHDDLQQLLFSLEIRLHLLQKKIEGAPTPVAATLLRSLGEIERMMEQALAVTRTISLELNPPVLRSEGLEASLAWLGTHMEERHRLQVDLEMPDSLRVASEDERILLVQFVRELLFNVSEHAGSNRARVSVKREGKMLVLAVADEGVGFEVTEIMDQEHWQQGTGTVGLISIRERLRLFGGRLLVESEPGEGTQITILMPLKKV